MNNSFVIRPAKAQDWPAMRRIFLAGIATGQASFETDATVPQRWADWVAHKHKASICVLQHADDDRIQAWGALAPTSRRECYQGVAEVQLYVSQARRGQGLGRRILGHLIEHAERQGLWTLQAIVFPENQASIALFQDQGFRQVGYREAIARMQGQWRDTLLFERRSSHIW